ncbi:MAG: choline monooxygenase [Myxococcota bacterium]|jgi:choline monooxygenase
MTDSLHSLVHGFDPLRPIEEALTPPSAWYSDPALAQQETESILRQNWLPIGHASQFDGVGDFLSGCSHGMPWVVVRDRDILRAFHNVCRHKAGPVAVGSGNAETLVCAYHGWRYRLDGRLASAPRMAGSQRLDRAALSLVPMGIAVWGPLVWIHLDPVAEHPASTHPEVDAALALTDWGDLHFARRDVYDLACNWKVFVDNYLDGGYHVSRVHPRLSAQLDLTTYETTLFERSSIQAAGAGDDPNAAGGAGRLAGGATYAFTYPNIMFNRYGPVLDTNVVIPVTSTRCKVVIDVYFDAVAVADTAFAAASLASTAQTQAEDVRISEQVQQGLLSPSYDRGPYAPGVEHAEHHFHQLLAADLRRAVRPA